MNLTVLEGGYGCVLGHRAGVNRLYALGGGDGDVGMHHHLLELLEHLPAGAAGKVSVETHRRRILAEVGDGELHVLPDVVGEFRGLESELHRDVVQEGVLILLRHLLLMGEEDVFGVAENDGRVNDLLDFHGSSLLRVIKLIYIKVISKQKK